MQRSWTCVTFKKKTPIGRHVPKYTEGRVVLRGDVVEDDCGSCEVFTVQGSSASHMSGANVLDVISRLPGCAGQASDAVSANAQVKLEDAPRLKKIQNQNVQMFGYVFHDTNGQNHGGKLKIPWYLLNEIYMVPFAGLLWDRQFEQALLELDGRKSQTGNVCSFIGNNGISVRKMWMTSKCLERSRIWLSCGRN